MKSLTINTLEAWLKECLTESVLDYFDGDSLQTALSSMIDTLDRAEKELSSHNANQSAKRPEFSLDNLLQLRALSPSSFKVLIELLEADIAPQTLLGAWCMLHDDQLDSLELIYQRGADLKLILTLSHKVSAERLILVSGNPADIAFVRHLALILDGDDAPFLEGPVPFSS